MYDVTLYMQRYSQLPSYQMKVMWIN